jgi:Neocarzinostatin family
MRTNRLVPALAIVGVLVAGLATPVAAADTPTVSATPRRKLADGQQIMVSASGFDADTMMAIVECPTSTVSPEACDLNTVSLTNTDSTGSYSDVPYTVTRILSDGTDCATNGGCYLGTQDVMAEGAAAGTLIKFDPNIPPIPPLKLSVRWDKTPKVNSKGVIGLKGALHCANRGSEVELDAFIRQLDGRAIYSSSGGADIVCAADTTVPFRMTIRPQNGLFAPGPATLNFQGFSFTSNTVISGRRALNLVAADGDFTELNTLTVPRPNPWNA